MKPLVRAILFAIPVAVVNGCASPFSSSNTKDSQEELAELNLQMGMRYMQQGNFDIAQEKLEKSLTLDKNSAIAHNAIAVLYDETDQVKLAEEHFQKAIDLDSEFTTAQLNYAQFLCEHDKPGEGEEQFLALAGGPPEDIPKEAAVVAYRAYVGAAVCALEIPAQQRAEAHLRNALALRPNDASALYRLADLHYATGNYLKARAFLERYHARADYNPESLWLGISIENRLGDAAKRKEYTRLLLSRFADSDVARRLQSQ